jgi:hypothetical protein
MSRRVNPWMTVGFDAWMLGLEASAVIARRGLYAAFAGPAAADEAGRMVAEKVDAALAWQKLALTGGLGLHPAAAAARTVSHYRRRVRANNRRLAKA